MIASLPIEGATVDVDEFGGMCPVQGGGTIRLDSAAVFDIFAAHVWYFRARGQHWSVEIGRTLDEFGCVKEGAEDLVVRGPSDDPAPYSAGYMNADECARHLTFALALFIAGIRGKVRIPDPADMLPPCIKCGAQSPGRVQGLPVCGEHRAGVEAALTPRCDMTGCNEPRVYEGPTGFDLCAGHLAEAQAEVSRG
jgi:hypothetical protein